MSSVGVGSGWNMAKSADKVDIRENIPAAECVHVRDLHEWKRNPRTNTEAVPRLAAAILRLGFGAPLVAQASTRRVIAGHTRRLAVLSILASDPTWTADGAPGPGMVPCRMLGVDDAKPLTVEEVDTTAIDAPRFWLSAEGPLSSQPDALEALRRALESLPGVVVNITATGA